MPKMHGIHSNYDTMISLQPRIGSEQKKQSGSLPENQRTAYSTLMMLTLTQTPT